MISRYWGVEAKVSPSQGTNSNKTKAKETESLPQGIPSPNNHNNSQHATFGEVRGHRGNVDTCENDCFQLGIAMGET